MATMRTALLVLLAVTATASSRTAQYYGTCDHTRQITIDIDDWINVKAGPWYQVRTLKANDGAAIAQGSLFYFDFMKVEGQVGLENVMKSNNTCVSYSENCAFDDRAGPQRCGYLAAIHGLQHLYRFYSILGTDYDTTLVLYTQNLYHDTQSNTWSGAGVPLVFVRPPTENAALPNPNAAVVDKALAFCSGWYADTESDFYHKLGKFTCPR